MNRQQRAALKRRVEAGQGPVKPTQDPVEALFGKSPLEPVMGPKSILDVVEQVKAKPPASKKERPQKRRFLGRFPDGAILKGWYNDKALQWRVEVTFADPASAKEFVPVVFEETGPSIHNCLEALWDQFCRWQKEQAASTAPKEPT